MRSRPNAFAGEAVQIERVNVTVASSVEVRRIIAEVAQKHGVLLEEGDPLFVALGAHAVVLQDLAEKLTSEVEKATSGLKTAVPDQVDAAMKASLESAAQAARRGIESDIASASSKARALVDAVHRSQSRRIMWMWIVVGPIAGALLFGCLFVLSIPVVLLAVLIGQLYPGGFWTFTAKAFRSILRGFRLW